MDPRQQLQVIDQPYIAQIAISPEQALKAYQDLRTVTAQVLKKGTDYDVIPGTPKPSLLKSGAENLLRFCGLGHRVEKVSSMEDWENGFFYFEYKVTVHKSFSDGSFHILSECIGSANSREPKYYKKKDGSLRNPYEQVNTLQKMAIKRALVGATLQATGASGLFTQDVEDMDLGGEQESHRSSGGQQHKPNTQSSSIGPSQKQIDMLWKQAKNKGLTNDDVHAIIQGQFKKTSVKELTGGREGEASDLISLLMSTDSAELKALANAYGAPKSKSTGPDEYLPGEDRNGPNPNDFDLPM